MTSKKLNYFYYVIRKSRVYCRYIKLMSSSKNCDNTFSPFVVRATLRSNSIINSSLDYIDQRNHRYHLFLFGRFISFGNIEHIYVSV